MTEEKKEESSDSDTFVERLPTLTVTETYDDTSENVKNQATDGIVDLAQSKTQEFPICSDQNKLN